MRLPSLLFVLLLTPIFIAMSCAPASPPSPTTADDRSSLSLLGQDTQLQFDFKVHPVLELRHQLDDDELCYMTLGDTVVVCTADASFLVFGPNDGVTLVRDNPASRLRLAGVAAREQQFIDTYASVFLIAGSIDRLPDGLTTYLADPGLHHRAATALARKMLVDNGATLSVGVRGSTFRVTLRLTESGREKLTDALQVDDSQGGILRVGNLRNGRENKNGR